jgi:enoyl-CoA hydratase/carnithine racemase
MDSRPDHVTPGESLAAAKLANTIALLPVSVISVGAGRVQGIASAVMMTGDRRLMLDGGFYHLPVSAAARGGRVPSQAAGQNWSAKECERLGVIDGIVDAPPAAASADPALPARMIRGELDYLLTELSRVGPRRLVETRRRRHRTLGQETEAGLAAIRGELREWQDVQQSMAKSLEEWRERMGQRMASQPRLSFQRPDLGEIAERLKARREELRHELLERAGRGDRSGE